VDHSRCIGRLTKDDHDKRWKPQILRESQCKKSVVEGSDLCTSCSTHEEKFLTHGLKGNGDSWGWAGRITEEPPDWIHMLGTVWAETKKPKWLGGAPAPVEEAAAPAPVPVLVVAPPPPSWATVRTVLAEMDTRMEPVRARMAA
jgi:hypothetical protein